MTDDQWTSVTNARHGNSQQDENNDSLSLKPYHIELSLKCPFKNCQNELLNNSTKLNDHLKELHNLRFVNLHHVYLIIEKYLDIWSKKINDDNVIQQLKIEIDNEAHERNNDAKLERKCLFCKNISDNRTILFRHMFMEHNFNIGLPDNLVNVNDFLAILEDKLNNLQCLYCEKRFTTPAVLRKHMRKKKHFKINARNRIYDKFYVINYLEPGKNWETFENENYESDEDYNKDDSWDDWNEEEYQSTNCLYCTNISSTTKECLNHMVKEHNFNLLGIKNKMGLDFYQTVILINYIRYNVKNNTCMACLTKYENSKDLLVHMNNENYNTIVIPEKTPENLEEQFKHLLKINKI
ncbi:4610_t:CDS:2 [Rhizophagus irregularis]|nr:4610_t:CDS:2 [Rhizophagus irregularis]